MHSPDRHGEFREIKQKLHRSSLVHTKVIVLLFVCLCFICLCFVCLFYCLSFLFVFSFAGCSQVGVDVGANQTQGVDQSSFCMTKRVAVWSQHTAKRRGMTAHQGAAHVVSGGRQSGLSHAGFGHHAFEAMSQFHSTICRTTNGFSQNLSCFPAPLRPLMTIRLCFWWWCLRSQHCAHLCAHLLDITAPEVLHQKSHTKSALSLAEPWAASDINSYHALGRTLQWDRSLSSTRPDPSVLTPCLPDGSRHKTLLETRSLGTYNAGMYLYILKPFTWKKSF